MSDPARGHEKPVPPLTPPGKPPGNGQKYPSGPFWAIWIGLVILVFLAAAVVWLLPDMATETGGKKSLKSPLPVERAEPPSSKVPSGEERKNAAKSPGKAKEVHGPVQEAGQLPIDARLREAKDVLSKAEGIDTDSQEAATPLKETGENTRKQRFDEAMGAALTALSENRLKEARLGLKRAASIYPGDPAVLELSRDLALAERAFSLEQHLESAQKLAEKERWSEASGEYEKALKIDKNNLAAQEGLKRAEKLAAIQKGLRDIVRHPERLRDPGPLKDAERTIQVAEGIKEPGPVLSGLVKEASLAVENALRPVAVTLLSDGKTDVLIYHVGRLGRFLRRTIALRPGRYVALGTRVGFRDVRLQLEVRPGNTASSFSITCNERI